MESITKDFSDLKSSQLPVVEFTSRRCNTVVVVSAQVSHKFNTLIEIILTDTKTDSVIHRIPLSKVASLSILMPFAYSLNNCNFSVHLSANENARLSGFFTILFPVESNLKTSVSVPIKEPVLGKVRDEIVPLSAGSRDVRDVESNQQNIVPIYRRMRPRSRADTMLQNPNELNRSIPGLNESFVRMI